VRDRPPGPTPAEADDRDSRKRLVGVSDYVAQRFTTVSDALGQPDGGGLLTTALTAALEPHRLEFTLESAPLETIGRAVARRRITCRAMDQTDVESVHGSITVLAVNSGKDPITEVLVTARVDAAFAREAAAAARRFLEQLTSQIADHGSTRHV
jgi:hypothetical protein